MGKRNRAKKPPGEQIHMTAGKNSLTSKGQVRTRKIGFASFFQERIRDAVRRAAVTAWEIERYTDLIIPLWMEYCYAHNCSTSDFFHPKEYMLRAIQSVIAPPKDGAQIEDPAQLARMREVEALLRKSAPSMLELGLSSSNLGNVLNFSRTRALTNLKNLVLRNFALVLRGWVYAAYKRDSTAARALGGGSELTDDELWKRCHAVTNALLARRPREDYPSDVSTHWREILPHDYKVAKSANGPSALHDALEAAAASSEGGALWPFHKCMAFAHIRTAELNGNPSAAVYALPPVEARAGPELSALRPEGARGLLPGRRARAARPDQECALQGHGRQERVPDHRASDRGHRPLRRRVGARLWQHDAARHALVGAHRRRARARHVWRDGLARARAARQADPAQRPRPRRARRARHQEEGGARRRPVGGYLASGAPPTSCPRHTQCIWQSVPPRDSPSVRMMIARN